MKIPPAIRKKLRDALSEDVGAGDITSKALVPANHRTRALINAKSKGILCGSIVAADLFRISDSKSKIIFFKRDGAHFKSGDKIIEIQGRTREILKAERTALNLLGCLSGIATVTHAFAERTHGTHAVILDTRKTTPLWRELEKYAVRVGSGHNHRFGLYDEVLVKENHLKAVGGLSNLQKAESFMKQLITYTWEKKMPIEVEVETFRELQLLLSASVWPDRILLDNFSIRLLKRAVKMTRREAKRLKRKKPLIEASGGVTLKTVRRIAKTGVDRISAGALTHSVKAADFSLNIHSVPGTAGSVAEGRNCHIQGTVNRLSPECARHAKHIPGLNPAYKKCG